MSENTKDETKDTKTVLESNLEKFFEDKGGLPPTKPAVPPPDGDMTIKFKNVDDPNMKAALAAMDASEKRYNQLSDDIDKLIAKFEDQDKTDKTQEKEEYIKNLSAKKEELKKLNPKLSNKYKDEVNVKVVEQAISDEADRKSGFPDYSKGEKPKDKLPFGGKGHPSRFNAKTGEVE